MGHPENVCEALKAQGYTSLADDIRKAIDGGIPWKDIFTNLLNMTLPVFEAWLQSILGGLVPKPADVKS